MLTDKNECMYLYVYLGLTRLLLLLKPAASGTLSKMSTPSQAKPNF